MDNKIEIVTSSNQQDDRKPYHTPGKMTVLGGIDAVVRSYVNDDKDASDEDSSGS